MSDGDSADGVAVAAIARGDRGALATLYDRYAGVMLAIGLKILTQRDEAEDVLHDVFVEVWRKAGAYDPRRGSVKTWLFLRMRSRCLDRVRTPHRARRAPLERRPDPGVPASAEQVSDARRVTALVTSLPPAQRDVLELAYYRGLSSSEIALELDIPVGTVKSRAAAALAKLRRQLAPGGTA